MHIDMQHLHQVFISVAITHSLSNYLGLEWRMAERRATNKLDSVLQYILKSGVSSQMLFHRIDRKLTTITLSLEDIPKTTVHSSETRRSVEHGTRALTALG